MVTVEFQAKVEDGIIVVPEEYRQDLAEANTVKVTLVKRTEKQTDQPDIIDQLTENPVPVPGIRSMTRDEMHER